MHYVTPSHTLLLIGILDLFVLTFFLQVYVRLFFVVLTCFRHTFVSTPVLLILHIAVGIAKATHNCMVEWLHACG